MNFSDFDGYMLGNMPVPWITMGVNFYTFSVVFFFGGKWTQKLCFEC